MAQHLIAFGNSALTAGTLMALTPIPDPTVTQSGTLAYVPAKYSQVIAAAGLVTANAITQAQLQAPSLRELVFPDISPLTIGASFGADHSIDYRYAAPLKLDTNEGLEFLSDGGGDGTTAAYVYGLVWLADGPIAPVKGVHVKLRATTAIAAAAGAWSGGSLTFGQTLPVGKYQIIGMRAMAAGLIAARLIYIGPGAVTRPGVPGQPSEQTGALDHFVGGAGGTLGEFESVNPPSIEVLGGTSTAQTYEFDLVKTA